MCALCVLMYIADSARMCGVCAFILSAALERQQLNNLGTKSSCCENRITSDSRAALHVTISMRSNARRTPSPAKERRRLWSPWKGRMAPLVPTSSTGTVVPAAPALTSGGVACLPANAEQACSSSASAEPLDPEPQEQQAQGQPDQSQQSQQRQSELRGPASMVAEVLEWAESSERLQSESWAGSYSSWAESSGEELLATIKSVAASLYNASSPSSPSSPRAPASAGSARAKVVVEGQVVETLVDLDLADTPVVSRAPSSCDSDADDREAMAYGYTADVPAADTAAPHIAASDDASLAVSTPSDSPPASASSSPQRAHAALAMAYGYGADVPPTPEPTRRTLLTAALAAPAVDPPADADAAPAAAPPPGAAPSAAAPSAADAAAAPGAAVASPAAAPPAVPLPLHFQHGFASISMACAPDLLLPRVCCVGHKAAMTDEAMWAFLSSLEQARRVAHSVARNRPHLLAPPRTSYLTPRTWSLHPYPEPEPEPEHEPKLELELEPEPEHGPRCDLSV